MAGDATDWREDGKAERFKQLAMPHLDAVYTLARYLMGTASDADDAVQECYLRAFRHFGTFRGGPIKPWLMAILRNACHDTYAAANARLVYTADGQDAGATQTNPIWREDSETPEQTMLRRQESETMRRLIGELSVEFREVIVLREINELSYRDIAAVIEAPIGTVMSRLARARALLRDAWVAAEGGSGRR
jgi:RNA polymerase sigma-70 factor (ECF subfamily)